MGITTHSEPNDREARLNNVFERKGIEMRPGPQDRPLRPVPSDAAPNETNEPEDQAASRRLGRLEYLLLALIALGVAITIAMAVVDPAG